MHLYEKRPGFRFKGLLVTLVLFAAVIWLFTGLLGGTGRSADQEQATLLENAIRTAAVSCYATDGRYPSSLRQLIAEYGIVVDTNRFIVKYDVFAANIMPDIAVIFRGESAT